MSNMMSLDSCKTYPRTAPHLLSTTGALELCLHPSAFPPRMSHHKSLFGKHWLFWHEPGRKRGVISFVCSRKTKKKVSKNKYFCERGAATRIIRAHEREIKMMDLLADVCSCVSCVCSGSAEFLRRYSWGIVFVFTLLSSRASSSELYM